MTKPNFTPGPWESYDYFVYSKIGKRVASTDNGFFQTGDEMNELFSNAHLIAAAPDLYELAAKVASLNKDAETIGPGMLNTLVDMAEIVTKKARGEA